jgi:DnaK suppressor protein
MESNAKVLYLKEVDREISSADIIDQASSQAEKTVEMRTLNRQMKLLSKINKAIKRIDDNAYGYCEETGEPIGLKRLIARPIATLSIEAQEKHEKNEKIFADM